ncbi:hypothetical protein D3C85_967600 [compost metagenome]
MGGEVGIGGFAALKPHLTGLQRGAGQLRERCEIDLPDAVVAVEDTVAHAIIERRGADRIALVICQRNEKFEEIAENGHL